MLRKFLNNRSGTAEVIGSVMFIVIIMFFFSNVYLWHDQATGEMNEVAAQKLNSAVTMTMSNDNASLQINDIGGVDVSLSRLWIDNSTYHEYFNLTNIKGLPGGSLWISAGSSRTITLNKSVTNPISENGGATVDIPYVPSSESGTVRFIILTTLGNTAGCSYHQVSTP